MHTEGARKEGGMGRKRILLPPDWNQPQVISDYLQWQHDKGLRERTREINASILNWLALWLMVRRGRTLTTASAEDLQEWRHALTVSDASVGSYISSVKAFYQWAAHTQRVPVDPAWSLPRPRLRRRKPRAISRKALQVAIDNAPDRIRPWLVLAAYAGLRASDIAGLRREDIYDDEEGGAYLQIGEYAKGGHSRVVQLSDYVLAELYAHGLPSRGPVFLRPDGLPNTAKGVSNLANEYLHGLGITETLHKLRHFFGRAAYRASRDLRTLQDALGHADVNTTALYSEGDAAMARQMVAAIQPEQWRTARTGRPDDPTRW